MKRTVLAAVLAVLCGALSGNAQGDVTGNWAMEITNPLGIVNEVALVLEQDGEALTGMADDTPLKGSVEGDEILMSYDVPETQVGPMTLTFDGTIDGSSMEGSVTFGQYASGTWTAARED